MPPMPFTALTTACMALMLLMLSARVLYLRIRLGQPLGDGGHVRLMRAVRVQGNFTEHVPMLLLLMLLLEWHGAPPLGLQIFGLLLLLARIVHAVGVSRVEERLIWRALGTSLTLMLLSFGAVALVGLAWWR